MSAAVAPSWAALAARLPAASASPQTLALAAAATVAVAAAVSSYAFASPAQSDVARRNKLPPLVPCPPGQDHTMTLYTNPEAFLTECVQKYGDIFRLIVNGKYVFFYYHCQLLLNYHRKNQGNMLNKSQSAGITPS
jgi:hypothetical protein